MNKLMTIDKNNASNQLERMIQGLEKAFGMLIVVHDHKGILSLPDGNMIFPDRNIHRSCCCRRESDPPEVRRRCIEHCQHQILKKCETAREPWRTYCWRHLSEVVVPIFQDSTCVGTLFGGTFRNQDAPLHEFTPQFREAYLSLPLWDDNKAAEISLLLQTVGAGLIQIVERLREENNNDFGRAGLIRRYISRNSYRDVRIGDLAKSLGLSESRTGHLIKESMNTTFVDLVNRERVRRARTLMSEKELSLAEIAERAGFGSEYYFNRVFKKICGKTPGAVRKGL